MENPCAVAAIPDSNREQWLQLHESYVNNTKEEHPDVMLVGASIIQAIQFFPIWSEKFVPLKSINLGISGDRTQNVLWRIQNGLLDHIKPKVCILNVGTNNIAFGDSPSQIACGILAVVAEIRSKLPDCHIIVIAILPHGPFPERLRELGSQVNKILKFKLREMPKVELYKAKHFLQPDGSLSQDDAPDFVHPSETGYRKIFNPLFGRLEALLNN